jgi:sortase A
MSEVLFTTRPRRGRTSRRVWRALSIVLILAGALVLLDAGVTLVWQEPFSALYAKLRQDHLSGTLRAAERAVPTPVERRALASLPDERRRIAFLASELERHAGDGSAVGRIVIPRIDASYVVVKGTDTSDLESGPGIYSETNFPGLSGTTAIAGHRTTYLAPFRHIDQLRRGSRILLNMPYAHFTYTVIGERVVAPTDVRAAVGEVGYSRLVLSACTPLFSAAKRLLVYARLSSTVPEGAARRLPGDPRVQPIEVSRTRTGSPARAQLPTVLKPTQQLLPPASS